MTGINVGIHSDYHGKSCKWIERFKVILDFNNIRHEGVELDDLNFFERTEGITHFIFRYQNTDFHQMLGQSILYPFQVRGVKVYPNLETCWAFDDKIKEYYLMRLNGFPMTETRVFYSYDKSMSWLKEAHYPLVFKLKSGAASRDVILVNSFREAKQYCDTMFCRGIKPGTLTRKSARQKHTSLFRTMKNSAKSLVSVLSHGRVTPKYYNLHRYYFLTQKFLPGNEYDTRVTVIGSRAFAFIRYNRDRDFRSSGSGKISYDISLIKKEALSLAFKISNRFGFQSMTYDFLINEAQELEFCEFGYTFLDEAVYGCPGYWDENLDFREGHTWPQLSILEDLLQIELVQPPITMMELPNGK